jgi:hypothetical protein
MIAWVIGYSRAINSSISLLVIQRRVERSGAGVLARDSQTRPG